MKVLVTGAEEKQGLAVIRGLGLRGVPVIACGAKAESLGFRSKFAVESRVYTSPSRDKDRFVDDLLLIARQTEAGLIIPSAESTLVALDGRRDEVESICPLAAADSKALATVVDKLATVSLAAEVGVPAPATVSAEFREAALQQAAGLRFPVAVKPRGSRLHSATPHHLGFKVRYASSHDDLRVLFAALPDAAGVPLVQECVAGTGVCVAAIFAHGKPLAMLPYRRVREVPLTGGVSVVRETIPLRPVVEHYVKALLERLRWHGVAMVEFKHDPATDRFVLMEINGRFQASTALSLDAGLNLPYLVYQLFTGGLPEPGDQYRIGIRERWLQGDTMALLRFLFGDTLPASTTVHTPNLPTKRRALLDYIKDFRPSTRYDEFKVYDPKPGVLAAAQFARTTASEIRKLVSQRLRSRRRSGQARD